jgi:methylmalonyl-CoA mutase N-terminal domain/subunit
VDPGTLLRQKQRLAQVKSEREGDQVRMTLAEIKKAALKKENLMLPILNAVKAYATVGEIVKQLKEVYGEATLISAY